MSVSIFSGIKNWHCSAAAVMTAMSLIATTSVDAAMTDGNPKRFDLRCKLQGREVIDHRRAAAGESSGRLGIPQWTMPLWMSLDLSRGLYLEKDWDQEVVKTIKHRKGTRIYFARKWSELAYYDFRSKRFFRWQRGAGYINEVNAGPCRRTRFTGLAHR